MKFKVRPVLFILAFSLALNLHALGADSFWGDEIFTAAFAATPPAEVIRWTASDIHPPFYYLVASTFTRAVVPLGADTLPTQVSDWLWRFPSVVAGVLAVAVTYRLALHLARQMPRIPHRKTHRRWSPLLVANATALLLCTAPVAIKYGQEARMHALFMLLAALATWLFFRAMSHPKQWTHWLSYALAIAACIYTMYFGFLILATHGGYLTFTIINKQLSISDFQLVIFKGRSTKIKFQVVGFGAAAILAFLLYGPWWPVLFDILRKRADVGAIEGGVGSPLEFVLAVIEALGPAPLLIAWIFFALFIIGLIFLAQHDWPLAAFGALWLLLPTLLPIFLGDPRALQFRYAFVLPVYLAIIVYGTVNMGSLVRLPITTKQAGFPRYPAATYLIWMLVSLSFVATLSIYNQTKPNWRAAAAFLDKHVKPGDIVLIGPLWDEGRFIEYYYRGQAPLLTPAAMVTNIGRRAEGLRLSGGRVWAVNRFAPKESGTLKNTVFTGVVVSEPQIAVYEPAVLSEAAIDLAAQAVEAAYPWADQAQAQGVLDPDPRTAQAAALRALGDTLVAAGRPEEALPHYTTAVTIFPGWVNGFIALAEAQEMAGNMPAAAKAYQQAVLFNPQWQGLQADGAAALIEVGQWKDALKKYHQIIEN